MADERSIDKISGNSETMVLLGSHLAIVHPPERYRHDYLVGEHRMVRAYRVLDVQETDWMCFDHGWECWMTRLARYYAPLDFDDYVPEPEGEPQKEPDNDDS